MRDVVFILVITNKQLLETFSKSKINQKQKEKKKKTKKKLTQYRK